MSLFNTAENSKAGFKRDFYDERVGFGTLTQVVEESRDRDDVQVAFSDHENDFNLTYVGKMDLDYPKIAELLRMEDAATDNQLATSIVTQGIKQLRDSAERHKELYIDGGSVFWENVEI